MVDNAAAWDVMPRVSVQSLIRKPHDVLIAGPMPTDRVFLSDNRKSRSLVGGFFVIAIMPTHI